MPSTQPTPWSDYRPIAESISQAVAEALTQHVGTHVELGIAGACDPEEMLGGRRMPLRATVVRMGRPLRDVMIFVSSLKDDAVRPLIEAAARAAIDALDVPAGSDEHGELGAFVIEDSIEYTTRDEALEECDALYLEVVYSLELPTAEVQMVLGTGLLEAANFLALGEVDPFAEAPAYVPAGPAAPAVQDTDTDAAAAVETEPAPAASAAPATDTAVAPGALDAFDAQLAAAEQAAPAASVSADAIAANPLADVSATRWTQLLSGVEVELSAELGRADLSLGEITSLNSESVLTLDQLVHEPVTVYVNGTPYATARLVVVDGEYGIEIIQVVDQASLVTSLAA